MTRHSSFRCPGCAKPDEAWEVVNAICEQALEGDTDALGILAAAIEHALQQAKKAVL